jgi:simple sugar transport system ATP-binding protein
MQKLILGRALHGEPTIILANQPTRGLDVGSIEYVHGQLMKLRRNGMGILLISSELEEVLALADVILVMYRGCVIPVEKKDAVTAESLGLIMARGLEAER